MKVIINLIVLICSIQLVISSSKIWRCNIETSDPSKFTIRFTCQCSNNCQEIDYNSDHFICDSSEKQLNYNQIKEIEFRYCSISEVNTLHINKFKSLEWLDIKELQPIDRELFDADSNVKHLDITSNKFTTISKNAFKHLKNLTLLSLDVNSFEYFEVDTFANLSKLTALGITENKLSSINETLFSDLNNLHYLWLFKNNITTIHKNAFKNLRNLIELELHFNSIDHIQSGTFASLTNLKTLNLSHNCLLTIENGTFFGLNNLESLDLSHNSLQKFSFDLILSLSETVIKLFIDKNQLIDLEIPVDFHFPALAELKVDGNKFTTIKYGNCSVLQEFLNSKDGNVVGKSLAKLSSAIESDGVHVVVCVEDHQLVNELTADRNVTCSGESVNRSSAEDREHKESDIVTIDNIKNVEKRVDDDLNGVDHNCFDSWNQLNNSCEMFMKHTETFKMFVFIVIFVCILIMILFGAMAFMFFMRYKKRFENCNASNAIPNFNEINDIHLTERNTRNRNEYQFDYRLPLLSDI